MAESFSTLSSVSPANVKSRKPEIFYRLNSISLSQDHSRMNRPLGWELSCIHDRNSSTSRPEIDHCIKEHEDSFGLTENFKLDSDLTSWVNHVERKHTVSHSKSIVQSAGGMRQARILSAGEFRVPSRNRQTNNSNMYSDSRSSVNAVGGFRRSCNIAIVGQPRPVHGTASFILEESQQETPVINWNEAKHLGISSNTSRQFRSPATNDVAMASVDGFYNLIPETEDRLSLPYHNLTDDHFRTVNDSFTTM